MHCLSGLGLAVAAEIDIGQSDAAAPRAPAAHFSPREDHQLINLTFVIAGHTPGAPPPTTYKDAARRFAQSYVKHDAGYPHRLVLIDSNGGLTPDIAALFDDIPHEVISYRGNGWDIGAHQFAALTMPADDWIMCFSSWAHFKQAGWLKAFVDARGIYGNGLYGSTSSLERNMHIRGTGLFTKCGIIHRYPYGVNSREESFEFEAGDNSLTTWCLNKGYGVWLVTPQATVPVAQGRELPDVFRRGNQSNVWTFDKHTDLYEVAALNEKEALAGKADGNGL